MPAGTEESRATSAISEDWQVGIALWFVPTVVALFAVFGISGMLAAPGSGFPGALDVVARWTLSSAGHVDWTAPVLVTAAFALAAICAAPIQERAGFASPVPVFALASAAIATALTVWALCALVTMTRLADLHPENPDVWQQFGAVSGIFLVAPLGVVAGMSAGRFQLLPLPARLAAARDEVARLEDGLVELSGLSPSAEVLRYRVARYGVPSLLALVLIGVGLVSTAAANWPGEYVPSLLGATVGVFAFSAFCSAVGASLVAAPTGHFSIRAPHGRRPTALGWIAGIILLGGALTPVAAAAYITVALERDAPHGTAAEFAVVWLGAIGPVLASALYAVVLLLPSTVAGHRWAARRSQEKHLVAARSAATRLEERLRESATGASGAESESDPRIDSAASTS
ncbi:hypothetical protein [Microbacterium sp. TNHR37B]|uniref:hypothetical protein n=1 Tax=Microbacterium sp. TNHR37B TaxID=1775956 RepID=UPI0007B1C40F|nr:hypothetical protein [Microbacterium sp. TNHR37B]KZE88473.1 hypothetical protein AVP41_02977 [Microbacterium sp. TNHR37B]